MHGSYSGVFKRWQLTMSFDGWAQYYLCGIYGQEQVFITSCPRAQVDFSS